MQEFFEADEKYNHITDILKYLNPYCKNEKILSKFKEV